MANFHASQQIHRLLPDVVVVLVPFPAQGHLNQLLHLSRLISAHNIPSHYVGTPSTNRQAKLRLHGWKAPAPFNNVIQFHDFPIPPYPSPDPNPSVNFPSHLQPSFEASWHLRDPVARLLRKLSTLYRRVVVIHDSLMGSVVQDFISIKNAESYTFHSVSAFTTFLFLWEQSGKPFPIENSVISRTSPPPMEGCFTPEFLAFIASQHEYVKLSAGRIYNSCVAMEKPFLDLLAREEISRGKKQFALGPFNPTKKSSLSKQRKHHSHHQKCLEWLDKQRENSVLFVSFGTTTSLSMEQLKEIAIGLHESQQRFVWVLRGADRGTGNVSDEDNVKHVDDELLLPGNLGNNLVGDTGVIIRGWAPQLEILAHRAVGGFLSHCGWNSCMESLTFGVPMAAWPMHSDQPRNAVLVTEHLRVGVEVRGWAERDEIVTSSTIKDVVMMLMASREGGEIRKRTEELGAEVRRSVEDGGVAWEEWANFITHITR